MSKRNSSHPPRSSIPSRRPTVLHQNLQTDLPKKRPPQNPPEEPPPPNALQEQNPPETSISSPSTLRSSRLVELRPPKTFIRCHIAKVYVIHGVLTLLAVVQLVTLRLYDIHFEKKMDGMVSTQLCLLLAMTVLLILGFVNIVNTFPVNYFLAVIIVELVMVYVNCSLWMDLEYKWTAGVLAIVLVMSLLLYVIGIFVPLKFLPGVAAVMFIGIIFILLVGAIVLFVYLSGSRNAMLYVDMLSLFYVTVIVVFTVTIVHQRRFDYLVVRNHVLQATILASLFVYLIDTISKIALGKHLAEQI